MFKNISILLVTLLVSSLIYAQKLSVEKIWKNYEFFGASVDGFRSMNDGNYFSKTKRKAQGISITKHAFSNYEGKERSLYHQKCYNLKMKH